MNEAQKKQYGLILKGKKDQLPLKTKPASVFGNDEDDDEEEKVDVSYSKNSASTIRMKKAAERLQESAMAEDPSIFDYDATYEEIQALKNQKTTDRDQKDKKRESKYAEQFLKTKMRRELEVKSREERQQQKEREKEGEEFADKEVFITSAYRQQMEEVQKYREEEEYEAKFNKMTSVEHQKAWQAGFGRQLLEDLARTTPAVKKTEDGAEPSIAKTEKKTRNTRKRVESRSPSPGAKESTSTEADSKKKSIYDDDEEAPEFQPPVKPHKNFDGELKAGLNRVNKKAETATEKLRARMFTPTPPSSDDESDKRDEKRKRDREDEKRRKEKEQEEKRKAAQKEEERKKANATRLSPEEMKAKRLEKLKEILKQRNGPEEIEVFRQRFIERRESGMVVPPFC